MERAAQLRAQGDDWPEVADKIGLTEGTVQNYPSKYPPFDKLVEWYQERLWQEELDELIRDVQPKALEALVEVLEARDVAGTEVGPKFSDLVSAARTALKSTGFEEAAKTRRKLEQQEEVTGEPGERVNVHPADDFGDLEDDELEDRIEKLEEIVHDE